LFAADDPNPDPELSGSSSSSSRFHNFPSIMISVVRKLLPVVVAAVIERRPNESLSRSETSFGGIVVGIVGP
jgi:hypothetical protein